jgi:hypothetical protein
MENVISLYDKLILHKITYETSSACVTAECELVSQNRKIQTSFLISHTDLNRILSKIISEGYEFDSNQLNTVQFEDGTEIVDYQFDQVFGEPIILEEFDFTHAVTEIRA